MPGPKLSGEPHLDCAWFFFILPLKLWRVAVVHVLLPTVLPQYDTEISPQADTLMNPSATPSPPDCSCCGAQGGLDAWRTTGWRSFMARLRGWACVSFYCASGCLTGRAAWVPPGPLLQRCSPLTQVRRASTGGQDSASLQVSRTELRHAAFSQVPDGVLAVSHDSEGTETVLGQEAIRVSDAGKLLLDLPYFGPRINLYFIVCC